MWLKIKEGETIIATIDFTSIKSVTKHWTGQRSELCLGAGCPHCLSRVPKRQRYQARLIVDGTPQNWEFGERVMTQLNDISHDTNFAHITITRIGDSRNTDYQVSQSEADRKVDAWREQLRRDNALAILNYDPEAALQASDFLRRKYGHNSNKDQEG